MAAAQPAAAPNINTIGQAFVRHYYTLFDTDRSKLANLYQNTSKLTFEGTFFQGAAAIIGKLTALNFKKVVHSIKSVDCQPSGCGGIIVFCCGDLKLDDGENPVKFAQTFHLMPTDASAKNFWVHNDIFRLNYG
eukprot:EW706611.1.p2 GENE.EW706611.1~~EW706611.1.p2  ORF type:complete len:134 (+),score=45.68 EW706611.1:47-448(+)